MKAKDGLDLSLFSWLDSILFGTQTMTESVGKNLFLVTQSSRGRCCNPGHNFFLCETAWFLSIDSAMKVPNLSHFFIFCFLWLPMLLVPSAKISGATSRKTWIPSIFFSKIVTRLICFVLKNSNLSAIFFPNTLSYFFSLLTLTYILLYSSFTNMYTSGWNLKKNALIYCLNYLFFLHHKNVNQMFYIWKTNLTSGKILNTHAYSFPHRNSALIAVFLY